MSAETAENVPDAYAQRERFEGTATYSPEDNKLRLYPFHRLDADTYARVKAAGFSWAPKQELFVAPMWTPAREDLLIVLAGEIDDEDTSLVDRAAERAERFEDYSDKRERDARSAEQAVSRIADNIPLGQPILVGHHSERHARKDAAAIQNGMRRAVSMWKTSQYWADRAKGAIRAAKYKERPDVRARRIKRLEAERRKVERDYKETSSALALWSADGLTFERALDLANHHIGTKHGAWSDLQDGKTTFEAVQADVLERAPRYLAHLERWIEHYNNRLIYEQGMLADSGGLPAEKWTLEVGGQVQSRYGWQVISRVNKRAGAVTSVSVLSPAYWDQKVSLEEIRDYRAPEAGTAEKIKKATALGPVVNYPGEGFEHMTKAEYDKRVPKWSDFQKLARYGGGDSETGPYRVRQLPKGGGSWNRVGVYLTDQKTVMPPAKVEANDRTAARVELLEELPLPEPRGYTPREPTEAQTHVEALIEALTAGVQVAVVPQLFNTPPELAERMVLLADIRPGDRVLEPSAGTGRLLDALNNALGISSCVVTAWELNQNLAARLRIRYPFHVVCEGDFLEFADATADRYDRIVMNPPFANAADIAHIRAARALLRPDGRLVALCANGPRQAEAFNDEALEWIELDGAFADEGTNVRVAIVVLGPA